MGCTILQIGLVNRIGYPFFCKQFLSIIPGPYHSRHSAQGAEKPEKLSGSWAFSGIIPFFRGKNLTIAQQHLQRQRHLMAGNPHKRYKTCKDITYIPASSDGLTQLPDRAGAGAARTPGHAPRRGWEEQDQAKNRENPLIQVNEPANRRIIMEGCAIFCRRRRGRPSDHDHD